MDWLNKEKSKTNNWQYQFRQYCFAVFIAVIIFFALSLYIYFRRGYFDLYIANKAFAGTSAILLGIILLLGPLSRFFSFPDRYIQYRKELGIIAFFLALTHGIVSYYFLPLKFSLSGFLVTYNWPLIFGLFATILLIFLFFISLYPIMSAIGKKTWWPLQYWGLRLVFALTFLHVFMMKWSGWLKWYKVGGGKELARPELPGAGLLVGWFMVFVVLMRVSEFFGPRFGRLFWYISVFVLIAIYVATFWWGIQLIK